jgi:HlyD family secretion protein
VNRIIPIAAVVVIAAGAAAWWSDAPAKLGWKWQEQKEFVLYGNVDIRQVSLAFRVNGKLSEALVDEGDVVKRGTVLARLDAEPYDYAVRSAEANAGALRATRDKLKAGARPTEIAQARASYEEQLADLQNANLAYDRAKQLRPQGNISEANLDQATAARAMAAARADSANQALKLLEEGSRAEDIAAAEAQLKAARTGVDRGPDRPGPRAIADRAGLGAWLCRRAGSRPDPPRHEDQGHVGHQAGRSL